MSESFLPHTIDSFAEGFGGSNGRRPQRAGQIGGYIVGGAESLIWALLKVLGESGHLV